MMRHLTTIEIQRRMQVETQRDIRVRRGDRGDGGHGDLFLFHSGNVILVEIPSISQISWSVEVIIEAFGC